MTARAGLGDCRRREKGQSIHEDRSIGPFVSPWIADPRQRLAEWAGLLLGLRSLVQCPLCQHEDSKVVDSRSAESGSVIRRRRECLSCQKRFTTYERLEELDKLVVVKRDQRREPFNREKLLRGIQSAFGKRPISEATKVKIVSELEEGLYRDFEREVVSSEIGSRVCEKLRQVDQVAYIRFASEYHRFADVAEIQRELEGLLGRVKDVKDQGELFST
jgi:transcriptional repressor NrdR